MTLAEIIISCFLLLMFMGACYSLFTRAIHTIRMGDERTTMLAKARNTIYLLTREFREAEELYLPDSSEITDTSTGSPITESFVALRKSTEILTILYNWNNYSIEKILYDPDFDPYDSGTWKELDRKVIASGFVYMRFSWIAPTDVWNNPPAPWINPIPQFVQISIKTKADPGSPESEIALSTKVFMRR